MLKILNTILEKEKALILGKLKIIQLIEADLQMLTRIFMHKRIKDNIEMDKRLSKNSYLHSGYSTDNSTLEKWLLYNNCVLDIKLVIYNIADLEAYYNH